MNNKGDRAQWASSVGFILAAAGSAVGLGNIWKFPGRAYNGGGGAFILIYILIVATIGATVMMAEFVVGRSTQKNAVGAFELLNKKWKWVGGMGVVTGFIILCYYAQVGGWVLKYIVGYITESGTIFADPMAYFVGDLLGADKFPLMGAIVYPFLFLCIVVAVIVRGVEGGIEKFNKFAMPALFVLLIVLMVRAVTLPGANEGVAYMLSFDFSKVDGNTFLAALGQAFFSLSLGMAIMITYGSYLKKGENLVKNTGLICVLDTLVALLAGFMIIPAVFATGVAPGAGGGFAFASLAGVFENMPMGALFGTLFYVLLLFAALTSAISLLEGTVAYVTESKGIDRTKATIGIAAAMFIIGIPYTLSQANMTINGIWVDGANGLYFPIFGDFMEFLTDRLLMPVGALAFCIFVGWVWGPARGIAEVEQNGTFKFALGKVWSVMVKYIAPIAIAIVIVAGLAFGKALS